MKKRIIIFFAAVLVICACFAIYSVTPKSGGAMKEFRVYKNSKDLRKELVAKFDTTKCIFHNLDDPNEPHGHGYVIAFFKDRLFVLVNMRKVLFVPFDDFLDDVMLVHKSVRGKELYGLCLIDDDDNLNLHQIYFIGNHKDVQCVISTMYQDRMIADGGNKDDHFVAHTSGLANLNQASDKDSVGPVNRPDMKYRIKSYWRRGLRKVGLL